MGQGILDADRQSQSRRGSRKPREDRDPADLAILHPTKEGFRCYNHVYAKSGAVYPTLAARLHNIGVEPLATK
jgi:hypothetical protein